MANYPKPTKGSRRNANTGYKAGTQRQLHEDRAVQAKVRQELYDKLSPDERLAKLNRGNAQNGHRPFVAKCQRSRIQAQVEAAKAAAVATPEPKKARKEKKS